jgi:arginine/lysine/histidine/glutamine transport system substrate-binding and permease protein
MRRIRFVRRIISVIFVIFLALSLTIHFQQTSSIAADNDQQRRKIESLTVVLEPEFAPFEFRSTPNGEIEGFDIDFLNALAEEIGFRINLRILPFEDLIPTVQKGEADAAISAISITDERARIIAFSRPYFKGGLAIAVKKSDNTITSLDSLQGKRIGVKVGTTGETEAAKVGGTTLVKFEALPEILKALSQGKVEAMVNDVSVLYYAIESQELQNLEVVGQLVTEEFYGIAMPQNSPYLSTINQGITALIQNGTYAKIYRDWFGADPPLLPSS